MYKITNMTGKKITEIKFNIFDSVIKLIEISDNTTKKIPIKKIVIL